MDINVTRAGWNVWVLADLLKRPVGAHHEIRGPAVRYYSAMIKVPPGPYASLDEALAAIEKHTHMVCRRAPGPP
jgi:hypothetical protein